MYVLCIYFLNIRHLSLYFPYSIINYVILIFIIINTYSFWFLLIKNKSFQISYSVDSSLHLYVLFCAHNWYSAKCSHSFVSWLNSQSLAYFDYFISFRQDDTWIFLEEFLLQCPCVSRKLHLIFNLISCRL